MTVWLNLVRKVSIRWLFINMHYNYAFALNSQHSVLNESFPQLFVDSVSSFENILTNILNIYKHFFKWTVHHFKLVCFLFCLNLFILAISINKYTRIIQHHRFLHYALHVFVPEIFPTSLSVQHLCVPNKLSVPCTPTQTNPPCFYPV